MGKAQNSYAKGLGVQEFSSFLGQKHSVDEKVLEIMLCHIHIYICIKIYHRILLEIV
jgi:hypothetical protein